MEMNKNQRKSAQSSYEDASLAFLALLTLKSFRKPSTRGIDLTQKGLKVIKFRINSQKNKVK